MRVQLTSIATTQSHPHCCIALPLSTHASNQRAAAVKPIGQDQAFLIGPLEPACRPVRSPLHPATFFLHPSNPFGVKKFFLVFLLNCSRNGSRGIQEGTPSLQSIWTLTPASRFPSVSSRPRTGVTLSLKPPRKRQKSDFLPRLRAKDGKVTKLDSPLIKPNNPVVEEIVVTKRTYASTKKIVVVARPAAKKTSTFTKKLENLDVLAIAATKKTSTFTKRPNILVTAATRKTSSSPPGSGEFAFTFIHNA